MTYDCIKDQYTCANKRILKTIGTATRRSKSGFKSNITIYECESCEGCTLKTKCTKAKGNKQLVFSKSFVKKEREVSWKY